MMISITFCLLVKIQRLYTLLHLFIMHMKIMVLNIVTNRPIISITVVLYTVLMSVRMLRLQ